MDLKTTTSIDATSSAAATDAAHGLRDVIADALDAATEPAGPVTERYLAIEFLWRGGRGVQPVILVTRLRLH